MKSAITISLVPEAAGGPFVFWHDLEKACARAAELGFDAVEIFPPGPDLDAERVRRAVEANHLQVAAVGTGAGWVKHKFSLTSLDPAVREKALDWIRGIITFAAQFNAPAIIGSMQGRIESGREGEESAANFLTAMEILAAHAGSLGQTLLIEPLNRYETNNLTSVAKGVELVAGLKAKNVRLLLDLFHMNIEEQDMAGAIRLAGSHLGHVHLADSNRRAAGFGHTDFKPIFAALREVGYAGYLSAEVLPWPDSDGAAVQTISAFKALAR